MELKEHEVRTLAVMICDYAGIQDVSPTPDEMDIVIKLAVAANFPQDSIERLWRIHEAARQNYIDA